MRGKCCCSCFSRRFSIVLCCLVLKMDRKRLAMPGRVHGVILWIRGGARAYVVILLLLFILVDFRDSVLTFFEMHV